MKLLFLLVLTLPALLIAGCSGNKVIPKESYPQYSYLLIKQPSFSKAITSDANEDEIKNLEANKEKFATIFLDIVYDKVSQEKIFSKVFKLTTQETNPLILDCAFTRFDAGNRAMRYFIGFGAGKTKVEIQCKLTNIKDEVLKTEKEDKDVWGPLRLNDPQSYFNDFVQELADEMANFTVDYMKEPISN